MIVNICLQITNLSSEQLKISHQNFCKLFNYFGFSKIPQNIRFFYQFSKTILSLLSFIKDFKACAVPRTLTHKLFRGCREYGTRIYQNNRTYGRQLSGITLLPVCCKLRERWVQSCTCIHLAWSAIFVNTTTASTE